MDETFRVREGTADDVETIVRHRRLMFEEMGFTESGRNDEMDLHVRVRLQDAIPSGEYRAWLVEDAHGAVLAGAGLSVVSLLGKPFNPSGTYAYLMSLYVEPSYRRRGIARILVQTMIEWAKQQGLAEVKLHASVAGRTLYEAFGFKQSNEMRLLLEQQHRDS